MVAPVGPLGLDQMDRQHLAGPEVHDRDLALVDDGQDAATAMGGPDPEVMEAARPAQGHGAGLVDGVVAQAQMARRAAPGGVGMGLAQ